MTDKPYIQDQYRELTIMVGPGVDGKCEVRFGRHTESRRIREDGDGVEVVASVAERVELPEPMADDEIDEWLFETDEGRDTLKRHGWTGDRLDAADTDAGAEHDGGADESDQ